MNIFICFDILYCGHRNDIHFMMCILINTKVRKMEKYLEYFYEIASIPHGSGNIKAISDYLKNFAMENGFYVRQDEKNNIVIIRDAHPELADHEPVILQGHMDMVAVKTADTKKNMEEEGLDLYVEDNVLRARGTSLGGDDGIAVAYIMAILTGEYKTPRIEAIITVDEEIGMLGASFLDVKDITAKRMINIDQEEEGIILTSSAGGKVSYCNLPLERVSREGIKYSIVICGLSGGHSGTEIDKYRGNANVIMGRLLQKINKEISYELISINGGLMDNAIPRECSADIIIDKENIEKLEELVSLFENTIKNEYKSNEPDVMIYCEIDDITEPVKQEVLTESMKKRVIALLLTLPDGVIKMSLDEENLVQTSCNIGIVRTSKDEFSVNLCLRSSMESEKEALSDKIMYITEIAGGVYSETGSYPAWEYRNDSPLRDVVLDVFKMTYGKEPVVCGIHAGLETGIFYNKMSDMDIVSIGPDILDIHTPKEKLSISSTERVYNLVLEILRRLALGH